MDIEVWSLLIYILFAAAAAVGVLAAGLADTIDFLTGDSTFTGRLAIWQYVLSRWEESPYFGQGFGALWQIGAQVEAQLHAAQINWLMNEAHNGYLDVLAQTGIIGIILLGFSLISGFLVILFVRQNETGGLNVWKWFAVYVTLGTSFYNLTEFDLLLELERETGSSSWLCSARQFFSRGYSLGANSPLPRRADFTVPASA